MTEQSASLETMNLAELRNAVLRLGQHLSWETFQWLPSSWIIAGESGWHLFVNTHQAHELRQVLRAARQQNLL
jgi:hypothetical protein